MVALHCFGGCVARSLLSGRRLECSRYSFRDNIGGRDFESDLAYEPIDVNRRRRRRLLYGDDYPPPMDDEAYRDYLRTMDDHMRGADDFDASRYEGYDRDYDPKDYDRAVDPTGGDPYYGAPFEDPPAEVAPADGNGTNATGGGAPAVDESVAASRYRDSDELRYSLRSLEKRALDVAERLRDAEGRAADLPRVGGAQVQRRLRENWIGDGTCDVACNVAACDFDGPDCANGTSAVPASKKWASSGASASSPKKHRCATGCPSTWLGDGSCDKKCDSRACAYDAGDCGGPARFEAIARRRPGEPVVLRVGDRRHEPERELVELHRDGAVVACASFALETRDAGAVGDDGPRRGRRLLLDTYGESLVRVNRLYNAEFGTKVRKVPAHMPHMIDRDVVGAIQRKYAEPWRETASHRFRSGRDVQYAFAYFHSGGADAATAGRTRRAVTLPSLRRCDDAREGVLRHAKLRRERRERYVVEKNLDEVAFEMLSDDYNATKSQLDSIRARRTKFICVNDNVDDMTPELAALFRDFFASYYPRRSQFELPPGRGTATSASRPTSAAAPDRLPRASPSRSPPGAAAALRGRPRGRRGRGQGKAE
ncbi:hypothetical protein JL720_12078 [Aureococcus anophagefferens]|nr:hypothetical protein JL720_12078 [Aureococcus anophagefferens]